jgi:predicted ATPase
MEAYVKTAKRYMNREFADLRSEVQSDTQKARKFKQRYTLVTEFLTTLISDTDLNQLNIPNTNFKVYYAELTTNQKQELLNKILDFYYIHAQRWGGVSTETYGAFRFARRENAPISDAQFLNADVVAAKLKLQGIEKADVELISQLYSWLKIMNECPHPEDWLNWAFDPDSQPKINSALKTLTFQGDLLP